MDFNKKYKFKPMSPNDPKAPNVGDTFTSKEEGGLSEEEMKDKKKEMNKKRTEMMRIMRMKDEMMRRRGMEKIKGRKRQRIPTSDGVMLA